MHFVFLFGPPAVGKMTVGRALADRTGFKLLHNHMTVEPVLDIFPFGSPPFGRLVNEFRRRVIEEALLADLPGLVFTMVWGLEIPEDHALVKSYVDMVDAAGGTVSFVELSADLDERLVRNSTELRLAEKRSKRDLDFSRANVLELEKKHVMNTGGAPTLAEELIAGHPFLRVDNTRLSATDVAERITRALELPSPAPDVQ